MVYKMIEQKMALDNLIYKVRTGSNLYGTTIDTSDEDYIGIFVPTKDYVMGIKTCEQVEISEKKSKTIRNQKGDTDYTIYSLLKFIRLAISNNPNIIELFFVPKNCELIKTDLMKKLIAHRHLFISKKSYHTFKGYAYAQRRKLEVKKTNMTGRTQLVEQYGYDTKFASHLIRLLLECHELLVEETIHLPLSQNNLIRDIKLGKYSLEWILNKATELEKYIDFSYTHSNLQYSANLKHINALQIYLLEKYWSIK